MEASSQSSKKRKDRPEKGDYQSNGATPDIAMTIDKQSVSIMEPTPEEKSIFEKLDAKESGDKKKKTQAKKGTRRPRKKPLQDKADLLELWALEDDEADEIASAQGPRGGDAFPASRRNDARAFDSLLDDLTQKLSQYNESTGKNATDNEAIFVSPETRPPSLDSENDPEAVLKYVSPGFLMWLTSLDEFDHLEIDVVPLVVEKKNHALPAGKRLDIIHVVRWLEQYVGIDFSRALVFSLYRPPTPEKETPSSSGQISSSTKLPSLFDFDGFSSASGLGNDSAMDIDDDDQYMWIDLWMRSFLEADPKLTIRTDTIKALQPIIFALDFMLEKKSVFYVRFVYMAFAPTSENMETHLNNTVFNGAQPGGLRGHPDVTPFSHFASALRFLHLDEHNVNAKILREELLKSTEAIKRAGLDGIYLLSNLRCHYVGHYYHTPQESFTNETDATLETINKEFVLKS